MTFLLPSMRHMICLGTNKGECVLVNPIGPRERPQTQQTSVKTNSRWEITSSLIVNNQVILANDKGELLIFTKNLYSLKISLKLLLNGLASRIKMLSKIDEQTVLVRTFHPGLFKVDVLEGRVLWSRLLEAQNGSTLCDSR